MCFTMILRMRSCGVSTIHKLAASHKAKAPIVERMVNENSLTNNSTAMLIATKIKPIVNIHIWRSLEACSSRFSSCFSFLIHMLIESRTRCSSIASFDMKMSCTGLSFSESFSLPIT